MVHARLARFYRDRHNEVRGVDFTNFPPNKERTIRHSFQNGFRRKITKTVTGKRVWKRHARGHISIVGTAPICTIKWAQKILVRLRLVKHNEKFPQPLGSPLELLPSEEGTLTCFQEQGSRASESVTLMAKEKPGPQIPCPRKEVVRPSWWNYPPNRTKQLRDGSA